MSAPAPPPVPQRVVLAPHHTLLERAGSARQFGLDPEGSLAVEELPAPVLPLLERLRAPITAVEWVAEAVARGIPGGYAGQLLSGLVERGMLVDAGVAARRADRRAAGSVVVRGDGPLAAGIAVALARAGVGQVHVLAQGHVTSTDVGCGYTAAVVGMPRGVAAAAAVAGAAPGVDHGPPAPGRRPDLVVLADAMVTDPAVVTELLAGRVDHLPVLVREGRGVVGPLVLVGRSPCLRCVELDRASRDPGWPALSAQLAGRTGAAEPETVAATAALGAGQALLALDCAPADRGPPSLGAALELDLHAGDLRRRRWEARPDCACGAAAYPRGAGR